MRAITIYNNLKGRVSKETLIRLIEQARGENQLHLVRILKSIIDDSDFYKIDSLCTQLEYEALEDQCIQEIEEKDIYTGLGKSVSSEDIYKMITDSIIDLLEEDINWNDELNNKESGFFTAYNYDTKKPYRGINQILLGSKKRFNPKYPLLENPYYLTATQIKKHKGIINKDAKEHTVVYFTRLYRFDQITKKKLNYSTYNKEAFKTWLEENSKHIEVIKNGTSINSLIENSAFPILRYYQVYNGVDIQGIDYNISNDLSGYIKPLKKKTNKISIAEEVLKEYPSPKPSIKFGGLEAYYNRISDSIKMPKIDSYTSSKAYYTTLFHEYIHSTGINKRLNRKMGLKFGDKAYAFEELVAEFGASFLCAESGFLHYTKRNSAAYIKSWRTALIEEIKKDNRFIFKASGKAQKAVDYILQPDSEGIPKYLNKKNERIKKLNISSKKESLLILKKRIKPTEKVEPLPIKIHKKETTKGLNIPGTIPNKNNANPIEKQGKKEFAKIQKKHRTMADLDHIEKPLETFRMDTEIGKFLGNVEKKPIGSVVVTLDAPAGSGKTRFLFQAMNDYASQGKSIVFITLEEHSKSDLFINKRNQYISPDNKHLISIYDDDEIENYHQLIEIINAHDIAFFDSFGKLKKLLKDVKLELDTHLRKKVNGKLLFSIFQRTKDGKMRGSADSEFDADIILEIDKPTDNYKDNYVIARKNRYNSIPELKYNVFEQKIMNEEPSQVVENHNSNRKLFIQSL